ncbi:hypothetical protein N7453_004036 [Penicillium expansum]|nr:hypothetical protein N7453_004036 [Penicillium expansum]
MASLTMYHTTTRLIESAQLTPTEHSIWRAFLDEAIHDRPACSLEQALYELKTDWKRLVTKLTRRDKVPLKVGALVEARDDLNCFMLDQKPSEPNVSVRFDHAWVIPPSLFDDSDMNPQGSLYPLLRAFLRPARTSELQTILQTNTLESQLKNLFLFSPSIHSAFRHGHIRLFPPTNTPAQWNDETEARIKTASEVYVSTLCPNCRLSLAVGFFLAMAAAGTQQCKCSSWGPKTPINLFQIHSCYAHITALQLPCIYSMLKNKSPKVGLRPRFHLVPHLIRVQCYGALLKLGSHLYPRSFTGLVHQLPFGLYAKECTRSPNEGETLKLVERYTSIPAPLWIDEYQGTHRVLILTAMPGQTLDVVFHRLSYLEREQLSKDLKSALSQLRSIPNHTSYRCGDSHGGLLFDYRFPSGICDPFHQISEFNSFLVHKHVRNETRETVAAAHTRLYRSVFTHADLNPRNIMIEHGRLSGIVDWECAGFYPEYWEFTKLFYGAQPPPDMQSVIHDAFTGDTYEEELETERLLWYDTPFGI